MADNNVMVDYNASDVPDFISTDKIDQGLDDDRRTLTMLPPTLSELTRITIKDSREYVDGPPICLQFIEESNSQLLQIDAANFPPPRDPGIDEYVNITESDAYVGWQRYCCECHKYSMPRIQAVKDILDGKTTVFNLRSYCPQSIGIWLAFEIFCETRANVTEVDLSDSPFTESGCHTLSDFLEQSQTLIYLNLSHCRIGYLGISSLYDGLSTMKCLTHLNLSGCNMRDKGGVIVANAFQTNSTCTHLDLSHNMLYTESGEAIGEMLRLNSVLETLELGWNNLYQDDCIKKLLIGLKKNKYLKKLGLSWNGLAAGEKFNEQFEFTLAAHPMLEILDLQNNRLSGNTDELCAGLKRSRSLCELYIGSNPWLQVDLENFVNMLENGCKVTLLSLGKFTWITKRLSEMVTKVTEANSNIKIIFQGVMMPQPKTDVDIRPILIDRLHCLALKPKKKKFRKEMGHLFLQFREEQLNACHIDDFVDKCLAFGAKVDEELYIQIGEEWTKGKKVDVADLIAYYLNRHPTEPLP